MKPIRCSFSVVVAVITLAAGIYPLGAQTIRPLQIEDAVSALNFHGQGKLAVIAPNGESVAYTVCDPRRVVVTPGGGGRAATKNAAHLSMGCDIWLSQLAGGEARNITPREGNNWSPSWSPDGASIAYYSDRSGEPRLWRWDLRSGRSRMVADIATRNTFGFEVPIWTPEGKNIIAPVLSDASGAAPQVDFERSPPKSPNSNDAVPGSTVVVLQSGLKREPKLENERNATSPASNDVLTDFAVITVESGEVRRIARNVSSSTVRLSPDGRRLAFLESKRDRTQSLVVVDVGKGERRELVASVRQEFGGPMSWSPDSRWIAYTSASTIPSMSEGVVSNWRLTGDLYVVSPDGGLPRRFTGAPDGIFNTDFLPPLWDDSGKHLYAIGAKKLWRADVETRVATSIEIKGNFEVRRLLSASDERRLWSSNRGLSAYVLTANESTRQHGFYLVDLQTGNSTRLIEDDKELDHVFSQPVVAAGGHRVIYRSESSYENADLWVAGSDFTGARRLTTLNPQLEKYVFGRSRLIEFRSSDGKPLRATVLLPAGYEPGKRYPLVVWVYASAMGSRAPNRFGLVGYSAYNMHMLTTRGYAVMYPDIPVHRGSPMLDLMKAVMPAVDRAVEEGIADPDRLAVMGQSNGGYSTISLLVQTNRFKAGVMNAGFGNLIAFYGSMSPDGRGSWIPFLEELGGAWAFRRGKLHNDMFRTPRSSSWIVCRRHLLFRPGHLIAESCPIPTRFSSA